MTAKWIQKLPTGIYDMKQLKSFCGLKSAPSIRGVMLHHGAEVKKEPIKNSNLLKNVFIWKGFKK